jgi:hypothetical protein
MRRFLVAAMVPVCLVASFIPSTAAHASSKSPIELSPIEGYFLQNLYETTYHERIKFATPTKATVKVVWTLKLELVDKAGTPDPEMTASGMASGAAVDVGCSNHGILETTSDLVFDNHYDYTYGRTATFQWHHPDAQDSDPEGWYHCDHALQGPHGHQGLITVVATYEGWKCVATFKGTHSSLIPKRGKPNPNVKNGTASEPTCSKS